MKKHLMWGILSLAMLALGACSNEEAPDYSSATGSLSLRLGIDSSVASAMGSRAEYSDVTVDDLKLRLISAGDGTVVMQGGVADFGSDRKIKVGRYTLEAFYGSSEEDGFGVPYFYGSTEVTVTRDNVTDVDLTASLANSMVSIVYTEAFKSYFTSYGASVLSAAGRTTAFEPDETRPAYIASGDAKIFVSVTKPNGTSATLQPASFKAQPKHHYTVTLDVNNGSGSGDATLSVSFDETVAQEAVEIVLSDELMSAPEPTITCAGFTPGSEVHVTEGMPYSGDLKMTVLAKGLVAELPMVTSGADLIAAGWGADIDLMKVDDGQYATLRQLGLNVHCPRNNPDKMAYLDFAGVAKNLVHVDGASNRYRFTLYCKDRIGKVCEPVTLEIVVDKMELTLSGGQMLEGDNHFYLDLTCLSSISKNDLHLQYLNRDNNWVNVAYEMNADARSALYHLSGVVGNDATAPYKFRMVYGSRIYSNELTITPSPHEIKLAVAPADVWASHADVAIISAVDDITSAAMASSTTLMLSTAGGNYAEVAAERVGDSNMLRLNGLKPATSYTVKGYIYGDKRRESFAVSFTTEAALQLPNSTMEDWTEVRSGGATGTFWREYAVGDGSVWGTNNPMTTSADQGLTYGYTNASGTMPTDQAHSGQRAALVRSVGWGNGSTAPIFGASKMAYGDVGLLHLGSSRTSRPDGYSGTPGPVGVDDLNLGMAFASRPSSLTFWYKYAPKNGSDAGWAECRVIDASGAVIASASKALISASAYTKATLSLNYGAGKGKAARIYVMFRSCNDSNLLNQSTSNFNYPPSMNLSDGEYVGSCLYIDDIQLTY